MAKRNVVESHSLGFDVGWQDFFVSLALTDCFFISGFLSYLTASCPSANFSSPVFPVLNSTPPLPLVSKSFSLEALFSLVEIL
jgi:hypothetical protein